MIYSSHFPRLQIVRTNRFDQWLTALKDREAIARILARLERLSRGNPGDAKYVGAGVTELRIDWGPGYRVYFARRGTSIVLLLCAGDKRTQAADIREAQALAASWQET